MNFEVVVLIIDHSTCLQMSHLLLYHWNNRSYIAGNSISSGIYTLCVFPSEIYFRRWVYTFKLWWVALGFIVMAWPGIDSYVRCIYLKVRFSWIPIRIQSPQSPSCSCWRPDWVLLSFFLFFVLRVQMAPDSLHSDSLRSRCRCVQWSRTTPRLQQYQAKVGQHSYEKSKLLFMY